MNKAKIAIVGAGLSGLTAAHSLKDVALCTLFEKSYSPGGRLATRYGNPFAFDHGAQYFVARSSAFQNFLAPLEDARVITPWHARFVEMDKSTVIRRKKWDNTFKHYVGTPTMNAIGQYLATPLAIFYQYQITALKPSQLGWHLLDSKGEQYGPFDWVIISTPAAQALSLLPTHSHHYQSIKQIQMTPCFTIMIASDNNAKIDWEAALLHNNDISWISVNSSKPHRPSVYTYVIHSSNAYAQKHWDANEQLITNHLFTQSNKILNLSSQEINHMQLHRWRYANMRQLSNQPFYIDEENQIGLCGDWCIKGIAEGAFSSAHQLGNKLKILL